MSQQIVLNVNGIEVIYNHVILVLKGVSLQVPEGGIVALLGGNGAGKTTTLRAISNLLKGERGEVTKGHIHCRGERVDGLTPNDLVRRGVIQVMEGRHCFGHLTVEENLRLGAYSRRDHEVAADIDRWYEVFPRLAERKKISATQLSGGEQQMLAIGRALMSKPRLLMLDEPSLGIAPLLVKTIFEKIVEINREQGITILLVEQNASLALEISHRGYVLETGRIILCDESAALRKNPEVKAAYLGGG